MRLKFVYIFAIMSIVPNYVYGAFSSQCQSDGYFVEFSTIIPETSPIKYQYKILHNQKDIKDGEMIMDQEGYDDSFSDMYFWSFRQYDNYLYMGTQDFTAPQVGDWSGKADLSVNTTEGYVYISSMDCKITITE